MPELTGEQIATVLFALLVYFVLIYFVVRAAVSDGVYKTQKALHNQLIISNRLKTIELQKAGVEKNVIDKALDV